MPLYDAARRHAIAVVEALRTGIPTRLSTQALPDLRAGLTDLIGQDLSQFSGGQPVKGRLAWGPYGQGKTHVLTTVEHAAYDLGFAVSRVSLSREVSCHHLFNFYGRVASDIRMPHSKATGIHQLLSRKAPGELSRSCLKDPTRYSHPLPALVLENALLSTGEDQDLLYGDLMGTRLSLSELKRLHRIYQGSSFPKFEHNFRVTQHASAYFGVMADALALWGYQGWVILIDEVELVGRLSKLSRLAAYRNLNWLMNGSGTLPYPIYTFGVVASSLRNDLWFKETSTSTAKRSKSMKSAPGSTGDRFMMPVLAAEKLGPDAEAELNDFFEQAISSHCPTITPLDQSHLVAFLQKVVDYHGVAYHWDPIIDLEDLLFTIGSQPIRTYIRAVLESLDLAFLHNEGFNPKATDLVETSIHEDESFFKVNDSAEFEVKDSA